MFNTLIEYLYAKYVEGGGADTEDIKQFVAACTTLLDKNRPTAFSFDETAATLVLQNGDVVPVCRSAALTPLSALASRPVQLVTSNDFVARTPGVIPVNAIQVGAQRHTLPQKPAQPLAE